jgi:hypothetical protein
MSCFYRLAVMRVIVMGKEDMAPFVGELINRFVKIIEVISKNPSNPKFNHYVFESLGALVRYACAGNPTLTQQVESMLFPPFQAILQLDITGKGGFWLVRCVRDKFEANAIFFFFFRFHALCFPDPFAMFGIPSSCQRSRSLPSHAATPPNASSLGVIW